MNKLSQIALILYLRKNFLLVELALKNYSHLLKKK